MLTQCPNCETTFRVTAEILRVAEGQVRCGRCHTQFDALAGLLADGDPNEAETGRYLQTPPRPRSEAIEVGEPESMEEITLEGKRIEISGTYRVVDDDSEHPHFRQEVIEEWMEIEDDTDEVPNPPAAAIPEEEVVFAGAAVADVSLEPAVQPIEAAAPLRATRAPLGFRRETEVVEHDEELPLIASGPQRASALVWKIVAAPLALLLIAQVIHHHRAELARHPLFGAPLMSAYQTVGLPLTPEWDLHAYGVKQWGVVMDPALPGTLKVRASITNGAAFAQPLPLLKLVLEDRWGDQVRAREFEPVEYLDPGTAANRLLAPAQQTNATITIVDPGPDAEGFRFDVCLRGKSGPVCAAEVPQQTPRL